MRCLRQQRKRSPCELSVGMGTMRANGRRAWQHKFDADAYCARVRRQRSGARRTVRAGAGREERTLARQFWTLALQECRDIVTEPALVAEGTCVAAQQAVAKRRLLLALSTLLQGV